MNAIYARHYALAAVVGLFLALPVQAANNELTIEFTPAGLAQFQETGQRVVLVQHFSGAGAPVAWVVLDSSRIFSTNVVSWRPGIHAWYESSAAPQPGAIMQPSASSGESAGGTTVFSDANGRYTFTQQSTTNDGTHVLVQNGQQMLTFGLTSAASLSGYGLPSTPVLAVSLPPNETLSISPTNVIYVFATGAAVQAGEVFSGLAASTLKVIYPSGGGSVAIRYNEQTNGFVLPN